MGWFIPWLDKIAYVLILHPEVQLSQYVKHLIDQKRYKQAFGVLESRGEEMDKLTTRSVLFQFVWVILAVFVLSSVSSLFGKALVMSLGLRILIEEWREWLKDKNKLKSWLFWQIKREVSMAELKWYLYGMTGMYFWLVWWWV